MNPLWLSLTGTGFSQGVNNWLLANWSIMMSTQFGSTLEIDPMGFASDMVLSPCRIIVGSGTLYSIMSAFLLSFSSKSIGVYFVTVLDQINVKVRSSWSERSL
jgi:hypothetical protein